MIELRKETERVLLVGVSLNDTDQTDRSLDELSELAKTAGAETVGKVIQSREMVHPGTYVGKGKIEEIILDKDKPASFFKRCRFF